MNDFIRHYFDNIVRNIQINRKWLCKGQLTVLIYFAPSESNFRTNVVDNDTPLLEKAERHIADDDDDGNINKYK